MDTRFKPGQSGNPRGRPRGSGCDGLGSAPRRIFRIAMLRTLDGATIEEIMAATGWQSHTVRGAMAGR